MAGDAKGTNAAEAEGSTSAILSARPSVAVTPNVRFLEENARIGFAYIKQMDPIRGAELSLAAIDKVAQLDSAVSTATKYQSCQSNRAQLKRPNALTETIQSIVRRNPTIAVLDLLERLNSKVGDGVILEIDDKVIRWSPTGDQRDAKSTKLSALKDRLSRARLQVAERPPDQRR